MIYYFENIEIDTDRFELRKDGEIQPVEPQVFSLLELLVTSNGNLVSKDDINLRVWGGRVVSEAAVASRIRSARHAIGDDGTAQRLIRTVHGKGLRFLGEANSENNPSPGFYLEQKSRTENNRNETGQPSIAVLPFQMLASDERYVPLADALAHEIIIDLSRLRWLFVIARGSSFRFREPDTDLRQTARTLNVRYILTGTVTITDNKSIVTVELLETNQQRVCWAERYEGSLEDLLELRFALVPKIISALELHIPAAEASRTSMLGTDKLDAWTAYHRGLWHMYRFNKHDNDIAGQMFHRALSQDPNFARAHAGLSFTHFQNAFIGFGRDRKSEEFQTRQHAERSLELDPLDPFTNLTMGRCEMLESNLDSALPWFERSTELNPNYAFAIYNQAWLEAIQGKGTMSEQRVSKAIALSPLDPLHCAMLAARALSHLAQEDFEKAALWAERGARAPNAHIHILAIAAIALQLAGKQEEGGEWAVKIKQANAGYCQTDFFHSLPFTDEGAHELYQSALKAVRIY